MIKSIKYIILLISIFIIGCHELYDYNQIDSNQKVLVVEGSVTTDFGPYSIHLSQAIPFNQNTPVYIKGAKVYVKDNSGNMYTFFEKPGGLYQSDSASFRGKIGNIYTLYITTSDGLQFKSAACKIGLECNIDSLYGINENTLLYPQGTEGSLDDVYGNAFHFYTDITFKANQPQNIRIDLVLASPFTLVETHYIYSPVYKIVPIYKNGKEIGLNRIFQGYQKTDSFEVRTVTYSTQILNNLPIIKTSNDYSSGSKIKKAALGYMNETGSTEHIDDSTIISWASNWVAQIKAYTISNDAFNYYYNVIKQLNGSNNFFEPIPVQLKGNLTCISDSTKPVFGLFEASSVVIKYIGINYIGKYTYSSASKFPPTYTDTIGTSASPPIDTSSNPTPGSPIDTSGFIWP